MAHHWDASIEREALASKGFPHHNDLAIEYFSSDTNQRSPHMSKDEILQKVASGEITPEQAGKLLLTEAPARGTLYCKVSEKGAISVYGLQRMPVTLYVEQWGRLLEFAPTLQQFMTDNDDKLKRKDAK